MAPAGPGPGEECATKPMLRLTTRSWDDTVRLDLYYVDNWSIVQDLTIMAKTIHAVLRSRGAY